MLQVFKGTFTFGDTFDNSVECTGVEGVILAMLDVHKLILQSLDEGEAKETMKNIKSCIDFAANNEEVIFSEKSDVNKELIIEEFIQENNQKIVERKYTGLENDFTTEELFQIFYVLLRITQKAYIESCIDNQPTTALIYLESINAIGDLLNDFSKSLENKEKPENEEEKSEEKQETEEKVEE